MLSSCCRHFQQILSLNVQKQYWYSHFWNFCPVSGVWNQFSDFSFEFTLTSKKSIVTIIYVYMEKSIVWNSSGLVIKMPISSLEAQALTRRESKNCNWKFLRFGKCTTEIRLSRYQPLQYPIFKSCHNQTEFLIPRYRWCSWPIWQNLRSINQKNSKIHSSLTSWLYQALYWWKQMDDHFFQSSTYFCKLSIESLLKENVTGGSGGKCVWISNESKTENNFWFPGLIRFQCKQRKKRYL